MKTIDLLISIISIIMVIALLGYAPRIRTTMETHLHLDLILFVSCLLFSIKTIATAYTGKKAFVYVLLFLLFWLLLMSL